MGNSDLDPKVRVSRVGGGMCQSPRNPTMKEEPQINPEATSGDTALLSEKSEDLEWPQASRVTI